MKEMVEDSRIYVRVREMERRRNLLFSQHRMENMEATLPYTELMTYPPDWPELTQQRHSASWKTHRAMQRPIGA